MASSSASSQASRSLRQPPVAGCGGSPYIRGGTTEIAKNAFHNVSYFAGTLDDLVAGLGTEVVMAQAR